MKNSLFRAAALVAVAINSVITVQLYHERKELRDLERKLNLATVIPFENFICRRVDAEDFSEMIKAELILVSASKEIDGSIYQIITEVIPLVNGAHSFHEIGEPYGPGIEKKFLSEIPSGAIHYSWGRSPNEIFSSLYSATRLEREAGAPVLEEVVAAIREYANSR